MTTEQTTVELDQKTIATLSAVATATLTTVLLKKGLRNVWLRGTKPLRPGQKRVVGPAFTLRFVPAREDLATPESWSSPISTRAAIEAMPPGCVAVVAAMGVTDAGIFGDILCQRMKVRDVAALVTDGVMRDVAGVLDTNLPVWCSGVAAPPSVAGLTFVAWQEPIRSEEHTSELRSHVNLVCRLLLEKKKQTHTSNPRRPDKQQTRTNRATG